jgi:hypothetical protein
MKVSTMKASTATPTHLSFLFNYTHQDPVLVLGFLLYAKSSKIQIYIELKRLFHFFLSILIEKKHLSDGLLFSFYYLHEKH